MKKMNKKEYNSCLIGIFRYFDEICRSNNIKYSLIGGSLIGAIRNNGIIPWDDDIDVILMPEQYEKLIRVLKAHKNKRYIPLIPLESKDYYLPYIKIVDTRTELIEEGVLPKNKSGIFIDVFRYNYVPKNKSKYIYNKIILYRKMLAGVIDVKRKNNNATNIIKNFRRIIATKVTNYSNIVKKYESLFKYKKGDCVISNWPSYGLERELQDSLNTDSYVDHKFENIEAMIFENYNEILTTTFGDYMTPPPVNKRGTAHHMEAYWK